MKAGLVDPKTVRSYQRNEIEKFLLSVDFSGRVLDYGCGDQPYRGIVEMKGAEYHPWQDAKYPGTPHREDVGDSDLLYEAWDFVLCTQMLQYVPNPLGLLSYFRTTLLTLDPPGRLVLTYPTNWPEVEPEDLWRWTAMGIESLVESARLRVLIHKRLGEVDVNGFVLSLGGGLVAAPV